MGTISTDNKQVSRVVAFCKVDKMRQMVFGEVYRPYIDGDDDTVDTDGQAMNAIEIEKMAHNLLIKVQKESVLDKQHNRQPGDGLIVESYIENTDVSEIAKSVIELLKSGISEEEIISKAVEQYQIFTPGSWVLGTKVIKEDTWSGILAGDITGYSIDGMAVATEVGEGGSD